MDRQQMWFAPLAVVAVVLIETLFGALISLVAPALPLVVVGCITGAMLSLLAALALSRFGMWRTSGIVAPAGPKAMLWFLPFFLYGLLPLAAGVQASAGVVALGIVFAVLISFWKLAVLALMFGVLLPFGQWRAAAQAAVLYGLMHLGGLLVGGLLLPTLLLALASALWGWAVLAVRLRAGALWPAMLANAVLLVSAVASQAGSAPNLASSAGEMLPAVVISAVLATYGMLALVIRRRAVQRAVSPA